MPKSRLSSDGRETRRSTLNKKAVKKRTAPSAEKDSHTGEVHRFVGISLSGGKADKACMAVLEYFPKHKKVFLSRLVEKIKSDEVHSADYKIHEIIRQYDCIANIAFDVPFRFPQCLVSNPPCPGIESCSEPHVMWMWDYTNRQNRSKKPRKLFTPYTQRCVEMYISTELEEPFQIQHAMGANVAPLLARAMYLQRSLQAKCNIACIEVFPKLSVWRVGRALNVMKSHLRFHKHSIGGHESRREIIKALSTHNVVFVYDQDVKLMIENNHAFEAFICALTGFLKMKGQNQDRPSGFPAKEDWIEFPCTQIKWESF